MTNSRLANLASIGGGIPEHLKDLSAWLSVDVSALSENDQAVYNARQAAIALHVPPQLFLVAIRDQTGVDPKTINRIMDRCLSKHADGRIYGFRAIIPYARLKQYERVHSADCNGIHPSRSFFYGMRNSATGP